MRMVVDPAQPPAVHVRVHLRRRQRAVTEELLDDAEVGTAFEEVRRERVPEPVRMPEEAPQRARVEPAPARREEEGVVRAPRELRARVAEVPCSPVRRLLA